MSPYDVLGVRPNASAEVIELAYKGRRSQYHPDRYQRSDAETLRWATQKMQEVNDAYAVLSDPRRRAQVDAQRAGERKEFGTEATTDKGRNLRPSLEDVLAETLSPYIGFKRVFFAPNIPMKKLSPALMSYGHGVSAEQVLVLVDTTVMGGAKEGMMFTEEALLSKELMDSPHAFAWADMRRIEASGTKVFVNTRPFMDCSMVDAAEMERLFAAVQVFVGGLAEQGATRPGERRQSSARAQESSGPRAGSGADSSRLFMAAKDKLVEFCEAIEPFEPEDLAFIDRESAVEYFDVLRSALVDPEVREEAEGELTLILALCNAADGLAKDLYDLEIDALLQPDEEDSQLVAELRETIARVRTTALRQQQRREQEQEQARRQHRVETFFKR